MVGVTSLIGILRWKRFIYYEYLILIIFLSNLVIDLYTYHLSMQNKSTIIYYNILTSVEIIITLIVYYIYLNQEKIKKYIGFSIILFLIMIITNWITFSNIFLSFASNTFFLGGFMVALFSYFVWQNEIEKGVLSTSNTILWFSAANFIYYIIAVPVMSANNWLVANSDNWAFSVHEINLVMYGIWATLVGIGFIWKQKKIT